MSRRKVLLAGGAGVAAIGLGATVLVNANASENKTDTSNSAANAASSSASGGALTLTKETAEGPFYLDYDKHRVDITEGKKGTPLDLRIQVRNAEDGKPLSNVAIDIWQCDPMGLYSSYEESEGMGGDGPPPTGPIVPRDPTDTAETMAALHLPPTSKTTYLRGFQMTDKNGWVRFKSIVPGWYQGRTVHIHCKVHEDGNFLNGAYAGGTTAHTGQLYFPDELMDAVSKVAPYSGNKITRVTNATDGLVSGDTAADGMLTVSWDKSNAARPVKASIKMAINRGVENLGHLGIRYPSASPSS